MTQVLSDQGHAFHTRGISSRNVSLYLDATYLSLRRNKVAKEAVHMMVGIIDKGIKEAFICVSDVLTGLSEGCLEVFPHTKHPNCWVHISRRVGHLVRIKDHGIILSDLKEVIQTKSKQEALVKLEEFKLKIGKYYPKVVQ